MSIDINDELLNEKIALLEKKAEKLGKQLSINVFQEETLQKIADNLSLLCSTEDMLAEQFQANMLAFKEFEPNVYNYFANYQPTEYFVDIKDGFANIYDKNNNNYLYQYPALLMILAQLAEYQKKPQSTHSAFEINEENRENFLHTNYLNKVVEVLENRAEREKDNNYSLPYNISSLVQFGVGVGYQIELLTNQHHINNLYIIEPNLDIFYCSLYTANWAFILEKLDFQNCNLHLCLGMQDDKFFNDLLNQTYQNGRYNIVKTFGYIHYKTPQISHLLGIFHSRFKEMIQGWGFFDDGVMAIAHTLGNLKNNIPLLKKSAKNITDFNNVPVFIIGNGPSLDASIDQIKKYQSKAIIISCGSALSALIKYGIDVDYHCEQERTYPVFEKVKDYGDPSVIKKHILLAPSTLHPKVFSQFDQGIMCAKSREPSTDMILMDKEGSLFEPALYVNPTVANTAIAMGYLLGYREFYFFGVDLGYKQGGSHHSEKSLYYNDDGNDLDLYEVEDSTNKVVGNFGGEFICNDFFDMSRRSIEKLLGTCSDIKCFNLSDGAKIEGSKPLNTVNLEHLSKIDKAKHLATIFEKTVQRNKNKILYNNLMELAAPQRFDIFCCALKDIIEPDIISIQQGIDMLRQQTRLCIDLSFGRDKHFVTLMDGSLLHYQAMLTRLLYESIDKSLAIQDFNEAKKYFYDFLTEAPTFYQNKFNVPHISNVEWWND